MGYFAKLEIDFERLFFTQIGSISASSRLCGGHASLNLLDLLLKEGPCLPSLLLSLLLLLLSLLLVFVLLVFPLLSLDLCWSLLLVLVLLIFFICLYNIHSCFLLSHSKFALAMVNIVFPLLSLLLFVIVFKSDMVDCIVMLVFSLEFSVTTVTTDASSVEQNISL